MSVGILRSAARPTMKGLKYSLPAAFQKRDQASFVTHASDSSMAPYTLYTWGTPNGWKAHIVLEELGLEYEVKPINIIKNVQKEDWFLKINPNGRIPALVDHEAGDLSVFESGAIMWYLVMKHDKDGYLWPKDFGERAKVMSWLMFQMGGLGPTQGQANHFVRFGKVQAPYAMRRFVDEVERLYSALELQLAQTEYLAGDKISIADLANWCWVIGSCLSGADYKKFPNLKKWVAKIWERPTSQKALDTPHRSFALPLIEGEEAYAKTLQESKDKLKAAEEADSAK